MSRRQPNLWKPSILVTLCLLLVGALPLLADAPAKAAPIQADQAERAAMVDSLLELPAKERRARLKAMPQAERRGLWFELKRAQAGRTSTQSAENAAYQGSPGTDPLITTPFDPPIQAVGTIQYDSGAPTTSFGGGALVGNQFSTHTGIQVFQSGTVTNVQALVIPGPTNTSSSAGFVLHGPQTMGGGANAIFSAFTSASGTADTVSFNFSAAYTGSSFFVLFGDFASSYIPVLGTGTTNSQGHHARVGYTGGMGPDITGTFDFGEALNAFVRASGNIVPVELMTFQVD